MTKGVKLFLYVQNSSLNESTCIKVYKNFHFHQNQKKRRGKSPTKFSAKCFFRSQRLAGVCFAALQCLFSLSLPQQSSCRASGRAEHRVKTGCAKIICRTHQSGEGLLKRVAGVARTRLEVRKSMPLIHVLERLQFYPQIREGYVRGCCLQLNFCSFNNGKKCYILLKPAIF